MPSLTFVRFAGDPDVESTFTAASALLHLDPLRVIASSGIDSGNRLVLAIDTDDMQFDGGLFYFNNYSEQRNRELAFLTISSIDTYSNISSI